MSQFEYSIEKANAFINNNHNAIVNNTFKPEVHFSAPIGWINDPNGFVYFRDEYHLFYQYYPYDSVWGPMHWGHAKTKDFVEWEHLPIALAPDMPYDKDGCFSGSAIVKDDTLWIMYTGNIIDSKNGNRQVQNVAFSKDGIHFQKLASNPVATGEILPSDLIPSEFRDPKLFEKDGCYYSVVAAQHKNQVGCIVLLSSENLVDWSFESIFLEGKKGQGKMWECPDYFEIDGESYLVLSPMRYPKDGNHYTNINSAVIFKGKVDWQQKIFLFESVKELDQGHDFYAPQTLIDDKGRRLMISWMHTWGRTVVTHELKHHWSGQMTIPRVLKVENNTIKQEFIEEVIEKLPIIDVNKVSEGPGVLTIDIDGSFEMRLGSEGDYITFGYTDKYNSVYIDRSKQALKIIGEEEWDTSIKAVNISAEKLTVVIDKSSIEILINDGEAALTSTYFIQGGHKLQKLI